MSDIDKIVQGFPNPTIPQIIGIPTYYTLKEVNLLISANASSIHSNRGNGALGHLSLTVRPNTYQTIAGVAFDPPVNPGATMTIPGGSSGPQIAALERTFNSELKEWKTYQNVDQALKNSY